MNKKRLVRTIDIKIIITPKVFGSKKSDLPSVLILLSILNLLPVTNAQPITGSIAQTEKVRKANSISRKRPIVFNIKTYLSDLK